MKTKKLLTVKKISEIFGINMPTIYWWIRNKKFKFTKVEKLIFIREADFAEFLDLNIIEIEDK